jgi:hypothetical protein
MTAEKAQQALNCDWHIPTKALFVITHSNYEHHDRPVIVLYETDPIAEFLASEFRVAPVNGQEGMFRQVFRYHGKLSPSQKKAVLDNFKAAIQCNDTPKGDASMPRFRPIDPVTLHTSPSR